MAAAAYQARERVLDERTGEWHDGRKQGPIDLDIKLLPVGADDRFRSTSALWNAAEAAERRRNSQIAKEMLLALPKEVSRDQRVELATNFVMKHFVKEGLGAQLDFHPPHEGGDNWHCHVLITTRRIGGDHFASHKARDLDPAIRLGHRRAPFVTEANRWNDLWREHQLAYFQAHKLALTVDPPSIHPLNIDFGPRWRNNRPRWGPEIEAILAARALLNQELSKRPALVWDHLAKTDQQFDPRAVDRFLEKNIPDPVIREDVAQKLHGLQRHALEEAQWAAHVPSRWREQTIEDVISELSPAYREAQDQVSALADQIRKAEWVRDRELLERTRSEIRLDGHLENMGWLRRLAHRTGFYVNTADDIAERAASDAQRRLDSWSIKQATAIDRMKAAETTAAQIRSQTLPQAEQLLARRQKIARNARQALDATQGRSLIQTQAQRWGPRPQ